MVQEVPAYADTVPEVVSARPVRAWILSVPSAAIEVVAVPPYAKVLPDMFVVDALVVLEVSAESVLKYEVEEAKIPAEKSMRVLVEFSDTPKLVPGVNQFPTLSVAGVM